MSVGSFFLEESDMNHSTLSNKELLALLIGERNAERLYHGSLAPLFLKADERNRSHGKLAAARELVRRFLAEELQRGPVFSEPGAVTEYLKTLFAGREHESFVVLFLDNRHRLIAAEELFRGTLNGTAVYPREVVKRALQVNAAAVIFAHNHPSGVAEPSRQDELLTEKLKESLTIVDIRVLDHLVVAGTETVSFAERGLI